MKKLLGKINSEKVKKIILKIPRIFVLILIIIVPPVGVWFLVVQVTHNKKKIYHNKRLLLWIFMFVLFIIGLGLYYKIHEIINLYDSGMSLDMMNFVPDDIHLYIIGLIMCISYFIGARILNKESKIQRVYTQSININHINNINEISETLGISLTDVKKNIKTLKEGDFLLPITVDNTTNDIIYETKNKNKKEKHEITKNKNSKLIKCSKCGAFIHSKKDEYVECDFCGNGLIEIDDK